MQKCLFGNILDSEKPVDFCRLSKVIFEVFLNISFLFNWFHNVYWFLLYLKCVYLFILFDIKVYAVPPSFLIRFANKRSTFLIIWFHSVADFQICITRLFKLCVSYLLFYIRHRL